MTAARGTMIFISILMSALIGLSHGGGVVPAVPAVSAAYVNAVPYNVPPHGASINVVQRGLAAPYFAPAAPYVAAHAAPYVAAHAAPYVAAPAAPYVAAPAAYPAAAPYVAAPYASYAPFAPYVASPYATYASPAVPVAAAPILK